MPVLISEIEIALTVVNDEQTDKQTSVDSSSKEEIIKECVEMVMNILNQKNER